MKKEPNAAHPTVAADAAAPTTLDTSIEARLADAEADVARLHKEKMELWTQLHGYAQPDERAACDRYSVLDEAGDALLKAGYHEAYEVVYRLMKEARATAPQATKGDEQSSSFRDLLRPVIAAKIAMGERDIQHGRFEEMFPKFLQAFDAALATPPQATVKGDEPAAYLVRGLNGYNEDSASAWINRRSAEGVAATLFRSSITPLFERAAVPQAEQRMSDAEDAARYRWLRDNKHLDAWWSVSGPADRCTNIDADIDAARKGASDA